ncbi:DUF2752 domain-containing protein [Mucilaginibacter myungsuensis]|uniref:DUF2752 domain-containing protein n=1 Tax=Mucilaginibacter myungsuensis TaxID=649104 RepID=A0A929PWE6_9SPHI|nr:DUF2752 domain-containing protein [Mucilaginibacter myungsuensis]MBE9661102.1 DUF2752 domain-containing protein [Mucilaginibacter myungsuensis]MDN3597246.1 DUF2752 domain-containing protein [Mucilaginibacter myungsuensis]
MKFLKSNFELIFWISALVALGTSDPREVHYTLCPIKCLGFTWCPGCGIGHAISWLFHGDIKASWDAHWLGIPALGVLLYRVYTLSIGKYLFPDKADLFHRTRQ